MKTLKSALLGATSLGIVIVMMAAFMPQKVHAVAATLVDVVNTVSVRDADNGPRHAVTLQGSGPAYLQPVPITLQTPDGTVFKVPAGKRLVIEHASGQYNLLAGTAPVSTTLTGSVQTPSSGLVPVDHYFLATYQGTLSFFGRCSYVFDQPIHAYVDAGSNVQFTFIAPGGAALVTVTGYLVDCAGACPVEP